MNIPNYDGPGVYAIKNEKNGKVYIGDSSDVQRRIRSHFYMLLQKTHTNAEMQLDFNNNDPFSAEVIRTFPNTANADTEMEAAKREEIKKHDSINNGYNYAFSTTSEILPDNYERTVYPAVVANDYGRHIVFRFVDFPELVVEGEGLANTIQNAERELTQWLSMMIEDGKTLPMPTKHHNIVVDDSQAVTLVRANLRSNKAVRRTVSLPEWLDTEANKAGISLSKVLQEALKSLLNMNE